MVFLLEAITVEKSPGTRFRRENHRTAETFSLCKDNDVTVPQETEETIVPQKETFLAHAHTTH